MLLLAFVPVTSAQVTVGPDTLRLSLPTGAETEATLAVTNEGSGTLALYGVPLPADGLTGTPGEMLLASAPGAAYDPYDLTSTDDGRLFVAEYQGGIEPETQEYSPDLALVGAFPHPEVGSDSFTGAVAWMPPGHAPEGHPEGTLWWLDRASSFAGGTWRLEHALLLEGALDGTPTGCAIDITHAVGPGASNWDSGIPTGLAFDDEAAGGAGLFYYIDAINEDIWAVGIDGTVAAGYPIPLSDYDPGTPLSMAEAGLDASRGEDGGAYFDLPLALPGEGAYSRVVVTDRFGRNTGAETPLTLLEPPDGAGQITRPEGVVRSRLDPSVLCLPLPPHSLNFLGDRFQLLQASGI
ncbi:MAG: hypothetical protein R3362_04820 [Rhodothermales bacterium]|nr:hypothetical protein [Rhodothermales bacterium]